MRAAWEKKNSDALLSFVNLIALVVLSLLLFHIFLCHCKMCASGQMEIISIDSCKRRCQPSDFGRSIKLVKVVYNSKKENLYEVHAWAWISYIPWLKGLDAAAWVQTWTGWKQMSKSGALVVSNGRGVEYFTKGYFETRNKDFSREGIEFVSSVLRKDKSSQRAMQIWYLKFREVFNKALT